jgi:hypothetical protein
MSKGFRLHTGETGAVAARIRDSLRFLFRGGAPAPSPRDVILVGGRVLEERVKRAFGDEEPKGLGTGWWSGVLSAFFGFLSLGAVLCLHYPQLLTAPELRPRYPMHLNPGEYTILEASS